MNILVVLDPFVPFMILYVIILRPPSLPTFIPLSMSEKSLFFFFFTAFTQKLTLHMKIMTDSRIRDSNSKRFLHNQIHLQIFSRWIQITVLYRRFFELKWLLLFKKRAIPGNAFITNHTLVFYYHSLFLWVLKFDIDYQQTLYFYMLLFLNNRNGKCRIFFFLIKIQLSPAISIFPRNHR